MRITELQSKDFHLDRPLFFACREDRERFCAETQSGHGRVYKCLKLNKFKPTMSDECRMQLTRRQKLNGQNLRTDRAFVAACSRDLLKNKCVSGAMQRSGVDALTLTSAMLCLEGVVNDGGVLESGCVKEMVDHRRMLMEDYELSPNLVKYCEAEIRENCGGGLERGGKTLHCLFGLAKMTDQKKMRPECFAEVCSSFSVFGHL
jgi:Golgi apparatus protein 1